MHKKFFTFKHNDMTDYPDKFWSEKLSNASGTKSLKS